VTVLRRLPTVSVMANWLGLPLHSVEYLIRSRGISPSAVAGNAMIYDESAFDAIARESILIESARSSKYAEIAPDTRRPRARPEMATSVA
jgi:hypothetical protein